MQRGLWENRRADAGVMTALPWRDPSLQSAVTATALHLPGGRGTSKSSHHRSPMLAQPRAPRKAAMGVPVTPPGGSHLEVADQLLISGKQVGRQWPSAPMPPALLTPVDPPPPSFYRLQPQPCLFNRPLIGANGKTILAWRFHQFAICFYGNIFKLHFLLAAVATSLFSMDILLTKFCIFIILAK
jgi:hypothetical protein